MKNKSIENPGSKIKGLGNYLGESALLINTMIWGGTFVIVKNSLSDISPMLFVSIRFAVASLILLPFALKALKKVDRKNLTRGFILGTLLFLGFSSQTIGLRYTSATKSGFITGSLVMFIPLFQFLLQKKKPSMGSMLGSLVVLLGLIFLSVKDTTILNLFYELGSNFNTGDVFTLLCAVCFALHIVYLDKISRRIEFLALTFLQISVTAVLSFVLTVVLGYSGLEAVSMNLTGSLLGGLAYTSLIATLITMSIQTKYQKEVSPTMAGIIFSFEPVFSALLAYFVLGERITLFGLAGCVLIFTGLLISELYERMAARSGIKLSDSGYSA